MRRRPGGRTPVARGIRAGAVVLLTALLAGAGSACGDRTEPARGLADSTYVATMARLALVDTSLTGSYGPQALGMPVDSARRLILAERGVDPDALLDYARRRGDQPERMSRVWTRIREVRDSLRDAGWHPGDATSAAGGSSSAEDPAEGSRAGEARP